MRSLDGFGGVGAGERTGAIGGAFGVQRAFLQRRTCQVLDAPSEGGNLPETSCCQQPQGSSRRPAGWQRWHGSPWSDPWDGGARGLGASRR